MTPTHPTHPTLSPDLAARARAGAAGIEQSASLAHALTRIGPGRRTLDRAHRQAWGKRYAPNGQRERARRLAQMQRLAGARSVARMTKRAAP